MTMIDDDDDDDDDDDEKNLKKVEGNRERPMAKKRKS